MKKYTCFLGLAFLLLLGCKKSAYLDAKPDARILIPNTIKDFQAILDNDVIMNGMGYQGLTPAFGEIASDNYYIDQRFLNSFDIGDMKLYSWEDEFYSSQKTYYGWTFPYRSIFYANAVIDGISKLNETVDQSIVNNLKGSAMFYRAHMLYQLSQIFCPYYTKGSSASPYGLPLRITTDVGEVIKRESLSTTYNFILSELKNSISLLSESASAKTRPTKNASYALIARILLGMQDYENAILYADSSLNLNNELMDYNFIDSSAFNPFPQFNKEVLFACNMNGLDGFLIMPFQASMDTMLYKSYDPDDLRKGLYFGDAPYFYGGVGQFFRGSYDGTTYHFSGLANDEVYLIRAECNARLGNIEKAMEDLNYLMEKRWRNTVSFPTFNASNKEDALALVLQERRKELLFRGVRWSDIRRLNSEGAQLELTRFINSKEFKLPPNSLHYTFLIPPDVTSLNPLIKQNLR